MISIQEIKENITKNYVVSLKYVRIGDEFRFVLAGEYAIEHAAMLRPDEKATSAGYFAASRNKIVMMPFGSVSLHIEPLPEDNDLIAKMIIGQLPLP